jgi:hypothetical protein
MKYISEEIAKKIGSLALDFTNESEFENYYSVSIGGTTIYRDFKHKDLLCSILFLQKESPENRKEGVHINVMTNGDVFARNFPYYDGTLELIAIYNQRKIFELIESA